MKKTDRRDVKLQKIELPDLLRMIQEDKQPSVIYMDGIRYEWSKKYEYYSCGKRFTLPKAFLDQRIEVPVPVLDEVERRYLKGVLRPFRKDKWLKVIKQGLGDYERITILTESTVPANLPLFEKGSMYKGMKPNRIYYPEDLGL